MKRAWIFAGGEFSPSHIRDFPCQAQDLVICVDSGLAHCLSLGWQPTLVVGDLDSVDSSLLANLDNVPVERYSSTKNHSDLQLALRHVQTEAIDEIVIAGVSGGRTDHLLFNWMLPNVSPPGVRLRMLDASTNAILITPKLPVSIKLNRNTTVSLFPLQRCTGVTAKGFEYPLNAATLNPGETRSLSNLSSDATVSVDIEDGLLWFLEMLTQ